MSSTLVLDGARSTNASSGASTSVPDASNIRRSVAGSGLTRTTRIPVFRSTSVNSGASPKGTRGSVMRSVAERPVPCTKRSPAGNGGTSGGAWAFASREAGSCRLNAAISSGTRARRVCRMGRCGMRPCSPAFGIVSTPSVEETPFPSECFDHRTWFGRILYRGARASRSRPFRPRLPPYAATGADSPGLEMRS